MKTAAPPPSIASAVRLDRDGESVGLAESVDQLAIGLRYDIHPPAGRD